MAGIQPRSEYLPAAFADYDGPDTLGRISGWVNGLFDFEVYRVSDEKRLFFRHVDVARIDDPSLQEAFAVFAAAMAERAAE